MKSKCLASKGFVSLVSKRLMSTVVTGSSRQVQTPLNYLGGERYNPTSTDTFKLYSPATGEEVREVNTSNEKDIQRAIDVAREAFHSWSKISPFQRGRLLIKAAHLIRSHSEELARTEVLDTGKPIWEARYDIEGCADTIEYYGGIISAHNGDFINVDGGCFAYTVREPLGVVGGIGAWNFPFQMAAWKSAPALACGNTLVFKPSPLTPLTAVMLGEIYREAGLPDGCYNVIQGERETGEILSSHTGINKITFTGSVPTGSNIMAACAKNVNHVTLELGGKSPLIIFEDCDLDNAVKGAMLANFSNQGQVCSNGTRVFVEKSVVNQFLDKLEARTKAMVIGDPNSENTTVGATISPDQAKRVLEYVDIAKSEGAKVIYGGDRVIPDPSLKDGYYLTPCILSDCQDSMRVVQEEIFGAVMSVLTFDTESEVISRANDSEFGLAGGIFTSNLNRAHRVASQMEVGSLYINNYNIYPVGVPFGGYKKSGIGRENGKDTLDYYSQIKSVYVEMNDVDCPY